jgi:hypothetical protein
MDDRLKYKVKIIKVLEDNIRENEDGPRFGDDFLHTTPKTQSTQKKEVITRTELKLKTSALCQSQVW